MPYQKGTDPCLISFIQGWAYLFTESTIEDGDPASQVILELMFKL